MNLYLLFAFALGAITGTADAPKARAPFAAVVAKSGVRAERREHMAVATLCGGQAPSPVVPARTGEGACPPQKRAPLTGAASPRAPSA